MAAHPIGDTVSTLCAYCGVGCGMVLQITTDPESGRRHIAKSIGKKDHPANFGRLCTKGTTTADLFPPRVGRSRHTCAPTAANPLNP